MERSWSYRRPSPISPRRWSAVVLLAAAASSLLAGAAGASHAPPTLQLPIAPTLNVPAASTNTSVLDLGMELNASVDVTQIHGGSGNASNWTFHWQGLPSNCTSQSTANYTCTPTATGTFTVSVQVNDTSDGATGTSAAVTITVNTDPVLSSFTVSAPSVAVNGTLTFTASASGGTAPLTFVYAGLPRGCSGNTSVITCTPTLAQAYNVSVYVVDGVGMTSAALLNVTVTVTGASASSSTSGPTLVQWAIIVVILVVGLGISALLFLRARREERQTYGGRSGPPPPSGGSPPPAGPSGGTPPAPPGSG